MLNGVGFKPVISGASFNQMNKNLGFGRDAETLPTLESDEHIRLKTELAERKHYSRIKAPSAEILTGVSADEIEVETGLKLENRYLHSRIYVDKIKGNDVELLECMDVNEIEFVGENPKLTLAGCVNITGPVSVPDGQTLEINSEKKSNYVPTIVPTLIKGNHTLKGLCTIDTNRERVTVIEQ